MRDRRRAYLERGRTVSITHCTSRKSHLLEPSCCDDNTQALTEPNSVSWMLPSLLGKPLMASERGHLHGALQHLYYCRRCPAKLLRSRRWEEEKQEMVSLERLASMNSELIRRNCRSNNPPLPSWGLKRAWPEVDPKWWRIQPTITVEKKEQQRTQISRWT